jgi:hypothetical protein
MGPKPGAAASGGFSAIMNSYATAHSLITHVYPSLANLDPVFVACAPVAVGKLVRTASQPPSRCS